jgi:hypothetical protein
MRVYMVMVKGGRRRGRPILRRIDGVKAGVERIGLNIEDGRMYMQERDRWMRVVHSKHMCAACLINIRVSCVMDRSLGCLTYCGFPTWNPVSNVSLSMSAHKSKASLQSMYDDDVIECNCFSL